MTENEISYIIRGASIDLHRSLGPGLLESVYEYSLAHDLREKVLFVEQQVAIPFIYKDVKLETGYRLDLLIERKVIVEVKSVEAIAPLHEAQLLTYLKLTGLKLGLLINFNSVLLKDNIIRKVNNL